MAQANAPPSLGEEVTCSICLEYFKKPVTINCGHTFCMECISAHIKQEQLIPLCPECRKSFNISNLNPNPRLANIVEMIQRQTTVPSAGPLCKMHQNTLQFFCHTDRRVLCLACQESQDHKAHNVVPVHEAAQRCKSDLLTSVIELKTQLDKVERLKDDEEARRELFKRHASNEGKKILNVFEDLQRFVAEQKSLLLTRLEEDQTLVLTRIQESVAEIEALQSSLKGLIADVEGKCQQKDAEFLEEYGSLLARFEDVKIPEPAAACPEETRLQNFYQQHVDLQSMITNFREWRRVRCFAADVTLDPKTAHPYLILSDDLKSVTFGETARNPLKSPNRFNKVALVLGSQGLGTGRHYWEVEVGDKTDWGLGVCSQSVNRGEVTSVMPQDGFWGVWLLNGDMLFASTSEGTRLTPRVKPRTVGIFLDYEMGKMGKVSFYSVADRSLLFTFTDTFTENLYPFFSPCQLENGRNAGPLMIRTRELPKSEALLKVFSMMQLSSEEPPLQLQVQKASQKEEKAKD